WYAACLGVVWLVCRRWHSGPIAMSWTLLLATTPIMLDHATLGNADLPLADGLLVGAVMLCDWLKTGGRRTLIGATIALAGASWVKFDGMPLGAGLLGAAISVRMFALHRQTQPVWPTVRIGVGALISLLAIGMCWHLYMNTLNTDQSIVG